LGEVWSFTTLAELPLPAGSVWKFEDTGTDLGTLWKENAFDDSAWSAGPAELGFGDGDESTVLTAGHPCYYFRRAFWVDDPAAFAELELQLLRDDGAIVYLNGVEVLRSNMPGTVSYSTYASVGIVDAGELVWTTIPVNAAGLTSGKNVLAVEVHQANANSSDISFDLALRSTHSVSIVATLPAGTDPTLSSSVSDATEAGGVGVGVGQTFLTAGAVDLTSITLRKGTSTTYDGGNKLRLTVFAWSPATEPNTTTDWINGDGTADGDPLNATGMNSLFSQDFDLPAGTVNEGDFIHFNLGTSIALAADTAYGFTSEFICYCNSESS
jgi:hypothetical protein